MKINADWLLYEQGLMELLPDVEKYDIINDI
jgi:hypothetical protein